MEQTTKQIVSFFLDKDILLSPDVLGEMSIEELDSAYKSLQESVSLHDILVLSKDIRSLLTKSSNPDISWSEMEKTKVLLEKKGDNKPYSRFMVYASETKQPTVQSVKVVSSYQGTPQKREVQNFIAYFNSRYVAMESILRQRQELQNITSISRISHKSDRENVALVGLVMDRRETKNGNIVLVLEDPTGTINVLVNKNKPDLFAAAQEIVLDEAIGVTGVNGDKIVFANNILWPEVPFTKHLKKSPDEEYALFLSDLHVGSNNFLAEDFSKFLKWLSGEVGTESQKAVARKVSYLFIVGDLVDGCGVYPEQDKELAIKDVCEQYVVCADYLRQIPPHIQIILCPGNHDAIQLAEPQPPFHKEFSAPLFDLPNVTLVSNPAVVNIGSKGEFPGFDVLLYHGYSFDYYVANVGSIRNQGGYNRADLIMRFLLKRRHLAPTYTSTQYVPDSEKDALVIKHVPDFFVTGHVHKSVAASYRNVTLICGSCWQSKTDFQERVGHNPEPSRVPIVNLKTREVKILRFG
ncbi:MAG TPA: DNA-directed DNA polymerase II small subunit [Candidatus Nanoarchaeia archaeon]|nr:DNA-directed DNA polymerase II small subunit [Candidatus Nanoarchaeia archaeon]